MKYTHTQTVQTPEGVLQDTGTEYTGAAALLIDAETVPANGSPANAVTARIPQTGLKCVFLLATVPCSVTLTGHGAVTLAANTLTKLTSLGGDVTGISIGANTTNSGPAGALTLRALWDPTP